MLKPMPSGQGAFACLTDWTFAKFDHQATMRTCLGDHKLFTAPELLTATVASGNQYTHKYTPHIDVYSFGKMLLAMVACTTSPTIIGKNVFPRNFPETAKRLVERTTQTQPEERGLFPALKHDPFFGDIMALGDEIPIAAISFEQLVDDATC